MDNSFTAHLTVAGPLQPPCAWAKMDGCQSTLRHQSPSKIKSNTPPEINTRPRKRDYFNRKYIFQPSIFRGHSLVFWGVNVTPGAYSTGNFRNSSPGGLILSLLAPFPPRPSISFWSWTSCFWILADRMTTYRAQLNNLKIIPFQKEKHLSTHIEDCHISFFYILFREGNKCNSEYAPSIPPRWL